MRGDGVQAMRRTLTFVSGRERIAASRVTDDESVG
jgi:hypothetical protein